MPMLNIELMEHHLRNNLIKYEIFRKFTHLSDRLTIFNINGMSF